jgi:hypothetical protein
MAAIVCFLTMTEKERELSNRWMILPETKRMAYTRIISFIRHDMTIDNHQSTTIRGLNFAVYFSPVTTKNRIFV